VAAIPLRRLLAAIALMVAAVAILVAVPASPASADPEGGTKTLREALESAAKGHVEATQKLANSKKRQKEIQSTLLQSQVEAKQLEIQVAAVAARSYRLGRFNTVSMLLSASSPDIFLERAQRLDMMAKLDGRALTRYREAVDKQTRANQALALEIKEQEKQVTVLAKKKREAELALASVGGGAVAGGFINANSPLAKPAPRNSDGSWPKESCTINDPTTSGCITPRTLHAMNEAKKDGFTRFVSCFRPQGSGEHPKGRACDFAADKNGFGGDATGASRTYGNRLADYFIANASRLGVLYVIWFRRIWLPSSGWKSYSGAGGDPSSDHTNHVHLSMR